SAVGQKHPNAIDKSVFRESSPATIDEIANARMHITGTVRLWQPPQDIAVDPKHLLASFGLEYQGEANIIRMRVRVGVTMRQSRRQNEEVAGCKLHLFSMVG